MTTRVFKRDGKVFTETKYNKEFVEFARSKKAKQLHQFIMKTTDLKLTTIQKMEQKLH